jgi:hypothetical protein
MSHVLRQRVEKRKAALIAIRLFHLTNAAELATRGCPSLNDRHATVHVFVSQRLEMRLNFVIQLRVAATLSEERDDA